MGTPAASDLPLAPGAGHGGEGDASLQGPAQETDQEQIETLPAQPKPTKMPTQETTQETTQAETTTSANQPSSVIELKSRIRKPKAAAVAAVATEGAGLATAHPKPAKRKNARERAKDKYAKARTEDGTTPTMTAKAKFKAERMAANKAEKKARKFRAA